MQIETVSLTENPSYWVDMRRRAEEAIEENYDAALEIGCMTHGGYAHLAEAVIRAIRGLPFDPDSVLGSER